MAVRLIFLLLMVLPAGAGAATPANRYCPVSKTNFVVAHYTTVYRGRTVWFCCERCIGIFEKNPAKYVAALPQFEKGPRSYRLREDPRLLPGLLLIGLLVAWAGRRSAGLSFLACGALTGAKTWLLSFWLITDGPSGINLVSKKGWVVYGVATVVVGIVCSRKVLCRHPRLASVLSVVGLAGVVAGVPRQSPRETDSATLCHHVP